MSDDLHQSQKIKYLTLIFGVMILGGLIFYYLSETEYEDSVEQANLYMSMKDYSKAYDEIRGKQPKDKDVELFKNLELINSASFDLDMGSRTYNINDFDDDLEYLLDGVRLIDENLTKVENVDVSQELIRIKEEILSSLSKTYVIYEDKVPYYLQMNKEDKEYQVVIENAKERFIKDQEKPSATSNTQSQLSSVSKDVNISVSGMDGYAWKNLNDDQKFYAISNALYQLDKIGYTINENEYFFIDALNSFYGEGNNDEKITVALGQIGVMSGALKK